MGHTSTHIEDSSTDLSANERQTLKSLVARFGVRW